MSSHKKLFINSKINSKIVRLHMLQASLLLAS